MRRFWFNSLALLGGALLTYLVVFKVFAQPRQFKGDFYAAMYNPLWWDGTGLFYGPTFVIERWLVDAFPKIFTVTFFSIQSLLVIFATLFVALKTVKSNKPFVLFGLFVWGMNSYFYYSYSVVANPEILELFFLVVMWWAMTRKFIVVAYVFFSLAVITKLVPIILLPIMLFNPSPYGLLALILIMISSIVLISVGQDQQVSSILKDLLPASTSPQPQSEQFLGLSNAISRLTGSTLPPEFGHVVFFSITTIAIIYLLVICIGYRFYKAHKNSNYEVSVAYCFAIFMCLVPIMHMSNTHRHTFLFLAPIWIALRFVTQSDANLKRSKFFSRIFLGFFLAYSLLPLYFLDGFPVSKLFGVYLGETSSSFIMITEPIWTNLGLLFAISCYGLTVSRDVRSEPKQETNHL